MTVTRSSGSGMRDLPCAGDGNRPRISCPRIFSSRPGSQHQLLHAFTARKNAANRNLLRQKLYCLHLQEPESKRARERKREQESKKKNKNKKARERKSKNKRERENKNKREKKNGKTPSLLRRIILRLGRITP